MVPLSCVGSFRHNGASANVSILKCTVAPVGLLRSSRYCCLIRIVKKLAFTFLIESL